MLVAAYTFAVVYFFPGIRKAAKWPPLLPSASPTPADLAATAVMAATAATTTLASREHALIVAADTAALPASSSSFSASSMFSQTHTGHPRDPTSPPNPHFMVLNLARRQDRWRCVQKEFTSAGIHPTRVVSVDAKERFAPEHRRKAIMQLPVLSASQKRSLVRDTGINTGHLATFLTHVSALERIRDQNLEYGCIFEDDISLAPGFVGHFREMVQELPSDWDILVLSMYCHTAWATCAQNNKLKPISKHLRPVVAFMSGAGYCLNARSAAKVLSTLPCVGRACGVAIDGDLSSLANQRKLKAYRAIDLPVIIPQDLMKSGKPVHVSDPDCYSRFDSDIAVWWKPGKKRQGTACIIAVCGGHHDNGISQQPQDGCTGNKISLRVGQRGVVRLPAGAPVASSSWWSRLGLGRGGGEGGGGGTALGGLVVSKSKIVIEEGETVDVLSHRHHRPSGATLFFQWHVVNVENTVFLHKACCAIVVSKDLWRGISVAFHYSGDESGRAVDVGWYEHHGSRSTHVRGAVGANTNKYKTLQVGEHFEIYLPDTSRTLVVALANSRFEDQWVVQPLDSQCEDSVPVRNVVLA